MTLKANEILAVNDIPHVKVEVPEWNGDVYLRGLTAKERSELFAEADDFNSIEWQAKFLAVVLVDENRQPIFSNGQAQGLADKNYAVVQRLALKAMDLGRAREEDVEEAEKN